MASFEWNPDKYQDVVQLLSILERQDHKLYDRRIKELLQRLGRYTPEIYRRMLEDTAFRQRMVTSLKGVLARWEAHNPATARPILDVKTYRRLILGIGKRNWDQVATNLTQLGFGHTVLENLQNDPDFRRQTFDIMSSKLKTYTRENPWEMTSDLSDIFGGNNDLVYMEDRQGAIDPLTRYYVLEGGLRADIETKGPKSLKFNILMGSPDYIVGAEHILGLPVTGDKDEFVKNYRDKYYTSDCTDNGIQQRCLHLAVTTGTDEESYQALRSLMLDGGHVRDFSAYHRYNVLDRLIADKDESMKKYQGIIIALVFNAVTEALSREDMDVYRKYFQKGLEMYKDSGLKEHPIHSYRSMIHAAVRTGNMDIIQRVMDDVSQDKNYTISQMYTDLSNAAAIYGDADLLEKIRELEWLKFIDVVHIASRNCKPGTIHFVESHFDEYFPTGNQGHIEVLRSLLERANNSSCFEIFRLCFNKLRHFPDLGYPDRVDLDTIHPRGKALGLYLDAFWDETSEKELERYTVDLMSDRNYDSLTVLLDRPDFLARIKHKYGSVSKFVLSQPQIGNPDLIIQFVLTRGYDDPSTLLDTLKSSIAGAEQSGTKVIGVLVNYYLKVGRSISRRDYEDLIDFFNREKTHLSQRPDHDWRNQHSIFLMDKYLRELKPLVV